ncbi:predicted protein [Naegleria gruberi]|uniref:Predicted protein n=1 Tax=Naegleria gruberi TaxID=5762 RepID=D2W5W5_NAEGR|nr:uncharacterized protein NAEGRDRAFT_76809 [Naegleria gruberi]EFC35537.1 predicted protein [Naegleria gruberi]|eukprot:XP_002668281.1 predicted protein [Naegleria gruberi strain NEG-M]
MKKIPQQDHPPDTEGSNLLADRIFVLERAIETYQKENNNLRDYLQQLVNICNGHPLLNNNNNNPIKPVNNNLINTQPSENENLFITRNPVNVRNLPTSRNLINGGNFLTETVQICDSNPKNRTVSYADITRLAPIKAQPSIKKTIAKQKSTTNKMKRNMATNTRPNKRKSRVY